MRASIGLMMATIACGGPTSDAPTWHGDVGPIVEAHCATCHTDGGVAPFALDDYDDVAAVAALVKASVSSRSMPPWGATDADIGLRFDISLSPEQIATIEDWVDAGAPEGDPDAPGAPIELDLGGLPAHDLEFTMPEPYATLATPGQDEYRCFVFDWPEDEPTFITGVEVDPGNALVAHHAVTFMIPPRSAAKAEEFDSWDEGAGYSCFGTASHDEFVQLDDGDFFDQRFVSGWAPGNPGLEYGDGAIGVEVQPGSKLVLQMHYSNVDGSAQTDQTTVRFSTADTVERAGYYMPWMNFAWTLNPASMRIPAGAENVRHSYRAEATTSANATLLGASTEVVKDGMLLYSVFAHTHKLGEQITYTLHRTDGTSSVLLHVDRYDFDWQREYIFDTPVAVMPGDELEVSCVFHNTAEWRAERGAYPTEPIDAGWGEGTHDEMCVAHSLMTSLE
jgi:hypothetical protein